jgi:choline dehydrogenase-like flavoprotein
VFDYIIVGAGSAGCVLAHRLSEDPSSKVLLIEAGGDDTLPLSRIPGAYPQLQDTHYDWGYPPNSSSSSTSKPQNYSASPCPRRCLRAPTR